MRKTLEPETVREYLEAIKARHGVSEYRIAQLVGITSQSLTNSKKDEKGKDRFPSSWQRATLKALLKHGIDFLEG